MSPSVLIIEDDPSILLGLRLNLRAAGYEVREATDGMSGLAQILQSPPDIVLLDLMLPGLNGLEVLRRLRQSNARLPVVILTAMSNEEDKVRGLDLGANDYVTKPFSAAELQARLRAVLRSSTVDQGNVRVLRAGSIEVEPDTRKVRLEGVDLEMTSREFDLLLYLMERPERVLTRDQIIARVWDQDYEGTDRTVDNFISMLRRKLGEDKDHPRHLRTVWGIGYRWVP